MCEYQSNIKQQQQ